MAGSFRGKTLSIATRRPFALVSAAVKTASTPLGLLCSYSAFADFDQPTFTKFSPSRRNLGY